MTSGDVTTPCNAICRKVEDLHTQQKREKTQSSLFVVVFFSFLSVNAFLKGKKMCENVAFGHAMLFRGDSLLFSSLSLSLCATCSLITNI